MGTKELIELTSRLADLVTTLAGNRASFTASARARILPYDGMSKGLAARQWLLELNSEISSSRLDTRAAIDLARGHLVGRAAKWYHLEHAERPFQNFDGAGRDESAFVARFTAASVLPGCSASAASTPSRSNWIPRRRHTFTNKPAWRRRQEFPFQRHFRT